MHTDRIRHPGLRAKITSAEQAALLVQDGMTVGMSGFTRAGDCKSVPAALAERAGREPLAITLITGASLGHDTDKMLAQANALARRMPFQVDTTLRRKINQGEIAFIDQHLSETAEQLRAGHIGPVDVAIIEAAAITETGAIVPTMSVGNSASFAQQARCVIIELNLGVPAAIEGLHDIYVPADRPHREHGPGDGRPAHRPAVHRGGPRQDRRHRHHARVPDSPSNALPPDAETNAIAAHINAFLRREVDAGRLTNSLLPLQAGIGTIANAVLHGFESSDFDGLTMYSEVLQDSAIELLDQGKLAFASASSITVSKPVYEKILANIDHYRERIVLRPQEISNAPEIVRRLGIIAINTALEFDIYGNVNSTHVGGTHMMNGIGGSGDFARNAHLAIFVSKSMAKNGDISSVVPMVSHVDHTEHDVDVLVTECGLADLRGLAPRERARAVIQHCVHPSYREALQDYFDRACERGGQTPICWKRRSRGTSASTRPTACGQCRPRPARSPDPVPAAARSRPAAGHSFLSRVVLAASWSAAVTRLLLERSSSSRSHCFSATSGSQSRRLGR
ncbi:succinate CoA transferase [Achromobacter insuavis]